MIRVKLCFILLLISPFGFSQGFSEFLTSFAKYNDSEMISFSETVQRSNPMTPGEALLFVYNGDENRLYCNQYIFNMETEKIEGLERDLYLPDKCLKIDMGSYYLIAFNSFHCDDPEQPVMVQLMLQVVGKDFKPGARMIVYQGNDFDASLNGILNSKSGTIFLAGNIYEKAKPHAWLYRIDPGKLSFEQIQFLENIQLPDDNPYDTLLKLGWESSFQIK